MRANSGGPKKNLEEALNSGGDEEVAQETCSYSQHGHVGGRSIHLFSKRATVTMEMSVLCGW